MLLTINSYTTNMSMHSKKTSVRRGNLKNKGCKAASHAVFYCPSKIKTGLICFKNVMTGCYRRFRPAVPLFGISTLFQPVTRSVERISDGLQLNKGVSIMLKYHAQEITLTNSVSLKSCFSVNNPNKKTIANNLSFADALSKAKAVHGLVKFQEMLEVLS